MIRIKKRWRTRPGEPLTDLDKKVLSFQNRGFLVPWKTLIKTPEQIEGIRQSGMINTGILDMLVGEIHAGMNTLEIDNLVHEFTLSHGAIPAPLNFEGFPKSCCTSINDVVCHGIPSEEEILQEGDIINVDVSTIFNGFFSDASRMFQIGKVSAEREKLVRIAKECLEKGLQQAQPWHTLGDIGFAVQRHAEKHGYSVVRELCGHGVGLAFHEEPDVEHVGMKGKGMLLVPGMTFTIEPMINAGKRDILCDEDNGWTIFTEDESDSAQWEHTILITESGHEILTY